MRPQPFLHELVTVLAAPTVALSGADGQLRPGGTQGVLSADRRILTELTVTLDGVEPTPLGYRLGAAEAATFTGVARQLGDAGADPTVLVVRDRTATPDGLTERITVRSRAHAPVHTRLALRVGADLAGLPAIKLGEPVPPVPPRRDTDAVLRFAAPGSADGAVLRVDVLPDEVLLDDAGAQLSWPLDLDPGAQWTVLVRARGEGRRGPFRAAPTLPWSTPRIRSAAPDLDRTIERGVADLAGLAMADDEQPDEVFLAAGSPWFFTLFGRDSLWAARMLLPLGTGLAAGTLRILARNQGRRDDPATGEAPGKIIHEVRDESGGVGLPPRYYGTVDATALWVVTLHEAWRWGMPAAEVRELLPALRAALGWLSGPADADGDGFAEYVDASGSGLVNQGWKDSPDAVQFADGTLAAPPIALCEAQAYDHQAARAGAALLTALGSDADADTAAALTGFADRLRERFRTAYWVSDAHGRFPALALDGTKRPVPVASSNLGHLLGTDLLDADEAAAVAHRLGAADLADAYGLRTLSAEVAGANPLGYHTGSVWPHDTAIAIAGLAAEGHGALAARLAGGLLAAAPAFGYRLPELFAGTGRDEPVLAYPASCRPQAWAAAAPVALLAAALGLRPDVPNGTLTVAPDPAFADWFPLTVSGLRLAGAPLSIEVAADGTAAVEVAAPDITVTSGATR
ncbi:glycogen debranching N-terminal domain-containing protein [Actinocatenispora comari]|uniref:Amylo-alpha-1,6-glucosidase n=1 Tax=Actinocatenispora comari TaxID=2807577 RepID=A0A8J4AEW6_9ACTN|nr:glycogen debranching N-terminal domain-containing protein [Actinocatenispora comari]GIL27393.1 amylo-alpha-1,6-glucosidase [Actinocatenispora comari]